MMFFESILLALCLPPVPACLTSDNGVYVSKVGLGRTRFTLSL